MVNKKKANYVAYVSTYTMGDSHGIRVYNVDMENGRFKEKDKRTWRGARSSSTDLCPFYRSC